MQIKPSFESWFNRVKFSKVAYFKRELKPLFEMCWLAACPPKKQTRSQAQNSYMWGVVYKIISDETGYTPDECHQLMAKQFLAYESQGEMFVKSTTRLNTKEMEDYLENVRRFATTELHCFIPLPRETEFNYKPKEK